MFGKKVCDWLLIFFEECNGFSFRDQIRRSAGSLPSDIAEAYKRQTNKEVIQFLFIAKGSCGEMRTQIYLALELEYAEKDLGKELIDRTHKIPAMLSNLIKTRYVLTKKWKQMHPPFSLLRSPVINMRKKL